MAPRKRVEKTVQNVEKKVIKRGRKKKIVNASAPPLIRVEIPTSSTSATGLKATKARVVTSQKSKMLAASSTKICKPRIVTNPNLSKTEIKVMLANEVVQAVFTKKSIDNVCKPTKPPIKRIVPKKIIDGRTAAAKKMKSVTLTTMDSDGLAFQETSEPKEQKSKTKVGRKKAGNSCITDADIVKNGPVKRRCSTNSGVNKTNPKIKKKVTQNCKVNTQVERKTRKRIGNAKKDEIVTEVVNNENSTTPIKENEREDYPAALIKNEDEYNSKNPGWIRSRKGSNASECLSWTKDISSSSTTTCVTVSANDYVLFDRRVPMIKLTNICNKSEDVDDKNSETLTDNKSTDNTETQKSHEDRDISPTPSRSRSLSLSSSSSSSDSDSRSSDQSNVEPKIHDPLDEALDKLTSNLKKFDTEIMKWIGYDNAKHNGIKRNFQDKVFEVLKEEGDVIVMCRNIKKLLLDDDPQYIFRSYGVDQPLRKGEKREEFVKPINFTELKPDKALNRTETTVDAVCKNLNHEDEKTDGDDTHPYDDRCNDDDDALSLYAESISGFDSYRKSTCISNEEYIPQPISTNVTTSQSITYMPTKITDQKNYEESEFTEPNQKSKSICEKQNADSTSYKDHERQLFKCLNESTNSDDTYEQSFQNLICVSTPVNSKHPTLMSSMYEQINCVKSVVFGGVCFFNLILSCKRIRCKFMHAYLDSNVIKIRLTQANEEMFIKEYMLMRNWPILRRKYGLLFVNEAINRELTRIVIEMAMDFVTKAKPNLKDDVKLKVEVLEHILLYLNKVDITTFADLLSMNIRNEECLCDIFMETLAETQNFSRFKVIFINLTNFIHKIGRHFSLNVATLLLERVCILPFEEPLALALLNILRRTSSDILQNSMIRHFEKSLLPHKELYNQLQDIKNQGPSSREYTVITPTPTHYDSDQNNSVILGELDKRCSPDTTNFDHLIKTHNESIISPTIDSNRAWLFDQSRGLNQSLTSGVLLQNNGLESQNFDRWKNRSVFNKFVTITNKNALKRRPNFKRQMDQHRLQYGGSLSKYPRRFGPDFL